GAGPGGPYEPNPEPLSSGVTGPDGVVRFALPPDDLVHLITERSERFAVGSFPIEVSAAGEASPDEIKLTTGVTFYGMVTDERGEPAPGVVLVDETFVGEPYVVATSDAAGAYRAERMAGLPRSFKRVGAGVGKVGSIRATRRPLHWLKVWNDREAFEEKRGLGRDEPFGVRQVEGASERNLRVWRSRRLRGTVVDGDGRALEGVRVGLEYVERRWVSRARERAHRPDGLFVPTDEAGAFELVLRHNDLEQSGRSFRRLVAVSPRGGVAAAPLGSLALGETREGLRIEMTDPASATPFVELSFVDREGAIRQPDVNWYPAWLSLGDGVTSSTQAVAPEVIDDRGELRLWPDALPKTSNGRYSGVLRWPGYQPLEIDLPAQSGHHEFALQRRPQRRFKVVVKGEGAPFVQSLRVAVAYAPADDIEGALAKAALSRGMGREGWPLRMDMVTGVAPGDVVELLDRPGEGAFVWVEMTCSYGFHDSSSEVIPLGLLKDSDEVTRVTIEAPDWGPASASTDEGSPLTEVLDSTLRYELICSETGKPMDLWRFDYETADETLTRYPDLYSRKSIRVPPGSGTLRLSASGYRTIVLGPLEPKPGATLDLGMLSLERTDTVPVRLLRPDGSPATGARTAWIAESNLADRALHPDAEVEMRVVAKSGVFQLHRTLADVPEVFVSDQRRRWSRAHVAPQRVGLVSRDGGLCGTLHPWYRVEVVLPVQESLAVLAGSSLVVRGDSEPTQVVSTSFVGGSAGSVTHSVILPPGSWTVLPPPGAEFSFEPTAFQVPEGGNPKQPIRVEVF
ncbi:MAG: hypothetical protein AAGG01_05730, partial [Planctomycetota bacterium]